MALQTEVRDRWASVPPEAPGTVPLRGAAAARAGGLDAAAQGLLIAVSALAALGVVMIFSVSAGQGAATGAPMTDALLKRTVALSLGALCLWALSCVDLAWLEQRRFVLLAIAVALLVLVLVPGIGMMRNGARRWLRFGALSVQPSEFARLGLLIYLAGYAKANRAALRTWGRGLLLPGVVIGAVCGLVFLEPDYGTALLMGLASVTTLLLAGARLWHWAAAGLCAVPVLGVMILHSPERWQRIVAFLNPEDHSRGAAYQMLQAVVATGSGGPLGAGIGAGAQKYFFLPQSGSDFIFAIIGEEFGLVGTAAVLVLFGMLTWCGMDIAARARDVFGSSLAGGLTALLGAQAALHVAVVTGAAPTKGITLPFVSMGGSSLVASMAAIGLILAVARGTAAATAPADEGLQGALPRLSEDRDPDDAIRGRTR